MLWTHLFPQLRNQIFQSDLKFIFTTNPILSISTITTIFFLNRLIERQSSMYRTINRKILTVNFTTNSDIFSRNEMLPKTNRPHDPITIHPNAVSSQQIVHLSNISIYELNATFIFPMQSKVCSWSLNALFNRLKPKVWRGCRVKITITIWVICMRHHT